MDGESLDLWKERLQDGGQDLSGSSNEPPVEPPEEPMHLNDTDIVISKETPSGTDRLEYKRYAKALAGLFETGELDILPTAVGIYAPWGAGKVHMH